LKSEGTERFDAMHAPPSYWVIKKGRAKKETSPSSSMLILLGKTEARRLYAKG